LECVNVNILLFGRTGCGKSSLGNVLLGRKAFEQLDGFNSCTQISKMEATQIILNDKNYNISVIDTPGFADKNKCDNVNIEEISNFLDENIRRINLIIIVIDNTTITTQEEKIFEQIFKNFGDISKLCHLIVTKCDGFKNNILLEKRKEIIKQPLFVNFCEQNISFIGIPNFNLIDEELHEYYIKKK